MRAIVSMTFLISLVALTADVRSQSLDLPPRPPGAPGRDAIVALLTPLSREAREDSLYRMIMTGNVPVFLRTLIPVTSSATINGLKRSVTYHVTPEYLSVGPDERPFLAPMTPLLAQRLADALHCSLPTRKMVNDIYVASTLKLAPAPIPPSAAMITVPVFAQHDSMVWAQREPVLSAYPPGSLVGGTHKDVVISNKIRNELKTGVPKPVVIYGWHQLDGTPIQPLYNGHGETYADYSHGIRLVQNAVTLDGIPTTLEAILKNDTLAPILSDEGTIAQPRYGDATTGLRSPDGMDLHGMMIEGNFPNPFNASTEIRYRLTEGDVVTLRVYDILGREAATLVDAEEGPGDHEVHFDGSGLASGVYIIRLTAGMQALTGTMLLMR